MMFCNNHYGMLYSVLSSSCDGDTVFYSDRIVANISLVICDVL